MLKKSQLAASLIVAIAIPSFALAQDVSWHVVLGSNANISAPGLPAANRYFTDSQIADVGKDYIGARLTSPDAAAGYWALNQGTWVQYSKIGVTGAGMGPARSGAEAEHVFLAVNSGGSDAGSDGQRALIGRAGDPADATTTTWGVWRWNAVQNIEVARGLTDGILGPNLGSNWVYQNNGSAFQSARVMNNGQTLISAYVTSPSAQSRKYIARSAPGQAVTPCVMSNSTDVALAPGLDPGDYFDPSWGLNAISHTADGRVYGVLYTNQSRDGIWRLCDGAPTALVVDNETGLRGPDIGVATATFQSFNPVHPGIGNAFYFFASYRPLSNDVSRAGLFWHDGASNRPLALNDVTNFYGPGWNDAIWRSFDKSSLVSAGEWTAFQGSVEATDGGTPSGLWRVRAGGTPELVALIGLTGQYGPEPNRTWDTFYATAILANGDIIAQARTQPGSEVALWRLKKDGTKQRILKVGQVVTVPTNSGVIQGSISSYEVPNGPAAYSRGGDSWIGADGSLLIRANLTTYGSALIAATLVNPIDKIYSNGFDE
ncbi:MAG TPA: hypothetical protein VFN25_04200 [Dokdonella sp.]|uniref:hypothetical protein n=1 Tax=Dokdonella sp. TaxID=2291710 RepID=UPI002D7F0AAB|nr:hypothetical protein [Dokdonella sp.]HET9032091.1 hypothetical protein [Dokdonella sp.]